MPKKEEKDSTQKLMDDKGDMADIRHYDETKIILHYETDAFHLKVPRTTLDNLFVKLEKIKNSKKLNPVDKENKTKETMDSWVQKKMFPKRILKRGEFWHDFVIFRDTLFEGVEFRHGDEQEKLKT